MAKSISGPMMSYRLAAERDNRGMTTADVAREAGVSRTIADRWFNPEHESSWDSYDKAAQALGYDSAIDLWMDDV